MKLLELKHNDLDYTIIFHFTDNELSPRVYIEAHSVLGYFGCISFNIENDIIQWSLPRLKSRIKVPEEIKTECDKFLKLKEFW